MRYTRIRIGCSLIVGLFAGACTFGIIEIIYGFTTGIISGVVVGVLLAALGPFVKFYTARGGRIGSYPVWTFTFLNDIDVPDSLSYIDRENYLDKYINQIKAGENSLDRPIRKMKTGEVSLDKHVNKKGSCPVCDKEVPEHFTHCMYCGTKIRGA